MDINPAYNGAVAGKVKRVFKMYCGRPENKERLSVLQGDQHTLRELLSIFYDSIENKSND